MAKSNTAKTNGHSVAALKPAAARKPAAGAAVKAAGKPAAVKAAGKPAAVKTASRAAPKPAAKTAKSAPKAAAKPAARAASKTAVKAAVKAAVKPAVKAPARAVSKSAASAAAASKAAGSVKVERKKPQAERAAVEVAGAEREGVRKAKLVRDSFTMPEQEYVVLSQVKKACLKAGFDIKKSELLRIGVALISQMDMATLQKVLGDLPQLKTGRPKSA